MRKSILLTSLIAIIAVTLAVALTQTDNGKEWFSVYKKPEKTTQDLIADAVTTPVTETAAIKPTPETTTAVVPTETPAATATIDATTTAAAETTAATTPTETAATDTAGNMTPVNLDDAQNRLNSEAPAAGNEKAADATAPAVTADAPKTTFKPDIASALKDVSIGSETAPITVYDYSSLTCPHCAHFHNEVLPKIKTDYIDKGKVRWVFKGFPLNEPALKGEMVARCAPKDQYIKLEDLMYSNQERWAFTDTPLPNLSMLLKLAGITDDMFMGCVNNTDLQAALLKKIQEDGDKYKLNSTPTFVLNDGAKVINGAGSYEGFAFDLDAMLKEKATASPVKMTPAK